MSLRINKYLLFCVGVIIVVFLDQITKYLIIQTLHPGQIIEIIPNFFNIVDVRNRGAAFGLLNRDDIEWQFWLFLSAGIFAAIFIIYLLRTNNSPIFIICLSLIFGGALGNLIDRIKDRAVIDFFDFYVGNLHWPAFNVADIAICTGAIVIAFGYLFNGNSSRFDK